MMLVSDCQDILANLASVYVYRYILFLVRLDSLASIDWNVWSVGQLWKVEKV